MDMYVKHKRPAEYTKGQDVICCVSQVAFSGKIVDINPKKTDDVDDITGYKIQLRSEVAGFLTDCYNSIFGKVFDHVWINETELVSLNNF
jgi:hypothetical protein